jgi:hypothetical protein
VVCPKNMLVFSQKDYLAGKPLLQEEFKNRHSFQLSIVHPRKYLDLIRIQLTAEDLANLIPKGDKFILSIRNSRREYLALGRDAIPFLDRDGNIGAASRRSNSYTGAGGSAPNRRRFIAFA